MKALVLIAALGLTGCATTGGISCPAPLSAGETAELLFGRNIGDREGVSEDAFRAYVAEELATRFPKGLTITDASGRWLGNDGKLIAEPSKLVMIVLSGEADEAAKLDAAREAYKRRFQQEAVLLIRRKACVGF
jgi:hypothetical protein